MGVVKSVVSGLLHSCIIMHLKELLLRFNVSHFLFYSTLLILSVLIGLRVDDIITGLYSVIFIPLWVWNIGMVVGVVCGVIRWCKSKEQREDEQFVYQFKSMIVSVILQTLIVITEVLIVVNIDVGGTPIPWSAVFSPLYLLMFLSIPTCIWGCYRKQGIEIEILVLCSFVQFIFLGVRLDNAVEWNWAIVFIPFWLMYLCLVVVLVILWIFLVLSHAIGVNQQDNEEKKLPDCVYFVTTGLFSLFIIVFMCLLVVRLNNNVTMLYSIVFIPLHLSLLALMGSTFSRKPANVWWFGLRKNFTDFVLDCCPVLQEYANVSYKKERNMSLVDEEDGRKEKKSKLKSLIDMEEQTNFPYEDIYTPD